MVRTVIDMWLSVPFTQEAAEDAYMCSPVEMALESTGPLPRANRRKRAVILILDYHLMLNIL